MTPARGSLHGDRVEKLTQKGTHYAFSILAAVAAALSIATPASAQVICGERSQIIAQLESKYGETRRSVGLQQGRGVVEVYSSEETGTWTILVTDASGKSCLMAAGEAFEVEPPARKDTPA